MLTGLLVNGLPWLLRETGVALNSYQKVVHDDNWMIRKIIVLTRGHCKTILRTGWKVQQTPCLLIVFFRLTEDC